MNSENGESSEEDESKKTPEMRRFEEETGKKAIWRGVITEQFKNWVKGATIYNRDKERISFYIPEELKGKWTEFKEKNDYTISRLIREAVNQFIDSKSGENGIDLSKMDSEMVSKISHDLKEPLTAIKGFSQLLIETQRKELNEQVYTTIKSIYDHSVLLENRIKSLLDKAQTKKESYDLLLIEDDLATIQLITSYFESKSYISKGIVSGSKGIEELKQVRPKAILLDVRLPDASGYEICKKIKEEYQTIPVYFLTATSPAEVEANLKSTGADGYISKPFNFSDFEVILKILGKK